MRTDARKAWEATLDHRVDGPPPFDYLVLRISTGPEKGRKILIDVTPELIETVTRP